MFVTLLTSEGLMYKLDVCANIPIGTQYSCDDVWVQPLHPVTWSYCMKPYKMKALNSALFP